MRSFSAARIDLTEFMSCVVSSIHPSSKHGSDPIEGESSSGGPQSKFPHLVNKLAYKPSLHDIKDKYYEMFRGNVKENKEEFFDTPDHSDHNTDAEG